MSAVGLSPMSVQLPGRMESVDDILARNGRPGTERRMFTKVYGLRQSPTLAPGERMEQLLAAAGRRALGGGKAALILYGHTLLTQEFGYRGGFPDWLRSELGSPGTPMYGVSHVNCVSVLRSVELARRFLDSRPGADGDRVLVLGGDHGSINDRSRFVPGMTVGGDAALAFTVTTAATGTGQPPPRYRYLGGASGRDTRFYRNLRLSQAELALFGKVSCEQAVATLAAAAATAGLAVSDLDWLMPHLSNAMFWRTFAAQAGVPRERICLDLLAEQGHNFGTDSLMALDRADRDGRLRPGQKCALISLGQGAYFQVVIVEVAEESCWS